MMQKGWMQPGALFALVFGVGCFGVGCGETSLGQHDTTSTGTTGAGGESTSTTGSGGAGAGAGVGGGGSTGTGGSDCDPALTESFNDGLSGGSIGAVQFDPRTPGVAYAAGANFVYRSVDSGASWVIAGASPAGGIVRFAFPPTDLDTIFVASGAGLLESKDDGATFQVKGLAGLALTALLIHPANPGRIFVGTRGAGIFLSLDGGASWAPKTQNVPYSQILSLAADPTNQDRVLAGLVLLNADSSLSQSGMVLETTTGGVNWTTALGSVGWGNDLAVCPDDPSLAFAAVRTGLAKSTDGGSSFVISSLVGSDVIHVEVAPGTSCKTVYATVYPTGVYRSVDGGASFTGPHATGMTLQPGYAAPDDLVVDPAQSTRVLAGTHGGLYTTDNSGDSWTSSADVTALSVRKMAVSPQDPGRIWLASWGSGVWTKPSPFAPWERMTTEGLPRDWTLTVAPDPVVSTRALVGAWADLWRSVDDGQSFDLVTAGKNPMAIAFDPSDSETVYAGTQLDGFFKSIDGGASWTASNGAIAPWPTSQGTVIDVRAVAVHPTTPNTLWMGTAGAGVYKSEDGAASWVQAGSELVGESVLCMLATGGAAPALYACVYGEGLFRSDDEGATWHESGAGLPSPDLGDLALDSETGILYATTKEGVFRSLDGQSWEPLPGVCPITTGPGALVVVRQVLQETTFRRLVVATGTGLVALPL